MSSKVEKDSVMDFAKYCDQRVRVRFQGGREVDGVLKGFDKLDNLVLEDAVEYLRGKLSSYWRMLCGAEKRYEVLLKILPALYRPQ